MLYVALFVPQFLLMAELVASPGASTRPYLRPCMSMQVRGGTSSHMGPEKGIKPTQIEWRGGRDRTGGIALVAG